MSGRKKIRIINVVGARPNFIKIAPIIKEMEKDKDNIRYFLVHTGQHFDREMSDLFFNDLKIPKPDFYLGVKGNSHASQTAEIMQKFEKIILKVNPDLVLVVGDVNSTLACALCAAKLNIPVAHIEAGLRSFDRNMPEEINRIVTDAISEYLFTTEKSGYMNLVREGRPKGRIYFVGNVMIDTLLSHRRRSHLSHILERLALRCKNYAVLTLHRPFNIDDKKRFINILGGLYEIQKRIIIVWPIHPRTKNMIDRFGLQDRLSKMENLRMVPPLGYLDFLRLMSDSKFILTDSGGIQEEATILRIPCITLRKSTERPVTVEEGTNIIVGEEKGTLVEEALRIIENGRQRHIRTPRFWDGKAAKRIVRILKREIEKERVYGTY